MALLLCGILAQFCRHVKRGRVFNSSTEEVIDVYIFFFMNKALCVSFPTGFYDLAQDVYRKFPHGKAIKQDYRSE